MKNKNIVSIVSLSVFYSQSQWHNLICDAILPFLLEKRGILFTDYYILLSTSQGAHIVAEFISKDSDDLQNCFRKSIKEFINNHPSIRPEIKLPYNSVFMDFANNTIESNVDDYNFYSFANPSFLTIRGIFSHCLIAALSGDEIDNESIISFMLYLEIGALKAFSGVNQMSLINTRQFLEKIIATFANDAKWNGEWKNQFETLFSENNVVVEHIVKDILFDNFTNELQWLNDWIHGCRIFFCDNEKSEYFVLLCNHTSQWLGINGDKLSMFLLKIIAMAYKNLAK